MLKIYYLDETVVERKRVADAVLPTLLVLAVVGEEVHDELVNLVQSAHLSRGCLNNRII